MPVPGVPVIRTFGLDLVAIAREKFRSGPQPDPSLGNSSFVGYDGVAVRKAPHPVTRPGKLAAGIRAVTQ